MSRRYSTRDFFRQMPNPLLARYFSAREVLPDFDFTAIKETKIDALFDAWMELPEAARVRLATMRFGTTPRSTASSRNWWCSHTKIMMISAVCWPHSLMNINRRE